MPKVRLYIGRLPFETTDAELSEAFAAYPSLISAKVILDHDSQKSRGFGFAELENADQAAVEAEAEALIAEFNGKDFNGQRLEVSIARPREERPATFNRNDRGPSSGPRTRY